MSARLRGLRRALPGGGFVLLVCAWGGLAVFLAWGFHQPDLDRAWWILQEADRGRMRLEADDAALLGRVLRRHPKIASARLGDDAVKYLGRTRGGWGTAPAADLVVGPVGAEGLAVAVECRCARRFPTTVTLEWGGTRRTLVFHEDGEQVLRLASADAPGGTAGPSLARLVTDGEFACPGRPEAPAGLALSEAAAGGAP